MENKETQRQIKNNNLQEDVIDLKELFVGLLVNWKAIFLAMLVGATLLGAYHTLFVHPSYQADAQIYIANTDAAISVADLQVSSALTEDYVKIIKSRTVLKQVIQEMKLNVTLKQLEELITVENPEYTHFIHISMTSNDLELSRDIVNCLLDISVNYIRQTISSSDLTIIDYAEADTVEELMPSLFKYLAMGALGGAMLVSSVVILRILMNTALKTEEDIEKYLHLPVLSEVPFYETNDPAATIYKKRRQGTWKRNEGYAQSMRNNGAI
ncbi:MAG: Wzz/FepE/Etk N-terminal domain-containing protein [Eubacteriales bacterium]|nr:Wzz/FepE/Etk N-terminal domain-containing protein [Eubacteriales bacterium]